jgi:uncharacterized protein
MWRRSIVKLPAHAETGRFAACCLALLVLAQPGFGSKPAFAQEQQPKTLMELLFKPKAQPAPSAKKPAAKPVEKRPRNPAKPRAPASSGASTNAGAGTNAGAAAQLKPVKLEPVEKLASAKVVMVVGDFFAAGMATSLVETYAQQAGVRIVDAANGDSGLVRDDFYDWPKEIGPLIETHRPAIIVVMVGANDRQSMTLNGKRETTRSPAWTVEYRRRVKQLAESVTSRQIPMVWVSQLPLRNAASSADMLALNDIYREAADNPRLGATYVDVWEGFVDENGKFMERGPNVDGQTVALRSGQVGVTRAGYQKIAFYAERALARVLGDATAPAAAVIGDGSIPPPIMSLPAFEADFARLRPLPLIGPDANTADTLLGDIVRPAALPILVTAPPPGRIDAFQLPKPGG